MFEFVVKFLSSGAEDVGSEASKAAAGVDKLSRATEKSSGFFSNLLNRYLGPEALGAALKKAAVDTFEYANRVWDLSSRLGVSTDALQRWLYAASQSGAEASDVEAAFRTLQMTMTNAASSNEIAQSYVRLGFTLRELQTLSPEQVFQKLSDTLATGTLDARRFTDVMKVMGRSAEKLVPAFREGFGDAGREFDRLKLGMSAELLAKLDEAGDKLGQLGYIIKASLGPALAFLANQLTAIYHGLNLISGIPSYFAGAFSVNGSLKQSAKQTWNEMIKPEASAAWTSAGFGSADPKKAITPTILPGVQYPNLTPPEAPKPEAPKIETQTPSQNAADALARIGLFVGGQNPAALQGEMVRELGRIRRGMDTANQTIRESAWASNEALSRS